MRPQPLAIACGYLQVEAADARQFFTIWQVALDAIELRYDASGIKKILPVERVSGYEVKLALEKATGCIIKIDWDRSRLTWGGGVRR